MKVLIATNDEHYGFVRHAIGLYGHDHKIIINTHKPTTDFTDYDAGISFMWTGKIKKQELDVPWINFHPAPLPEYKGRNLCYHALLNGAKEFGATVHYMDENFDTGEIIEVRRFPIEDSDDAESLSEKAIEESKALFKRWLPKILELKGSDRFFSTPNEGGHYYKKSDPLIEEIQFSPN